MSTVVESPAVESSVAEFLKTVPIFANSPIEQLEELAPHCVEQHFAPGELIIEQGRVIDAYYFLRHGRVAVKVDRVTGRDTVAMLDPPTLFGELSCITGEACSADIEVVFDTTVLKLPKDALHSVGKTNPEILLGMVHLLATRLHTTVVQGARAADKPVVILREHPNFEAPSAFSEGLVIALGSLINKPSLLVRIGDVKGSEHGDLRQLGPHAFSFNWPASLRELSFVEHIAEAVSNWQERFKSIVLYPVGCDRLAIADLIDSLGTERGELLGPGDAFPQADNKHERFVVGSSTAPQLPFLSGNQQLLFDAAESESNYLFRQLPHGQFQRTVESIARHVFRIQVGVACGGGAAWGFMHIGVLKVFAEAGVPIDVVSGNSAGTLIGGLWCLGKSPEEIREHLLGMTKSKLKLFELRPWRLHMIRESTVMKNFQKFYGDIHVNHMPMPFWANALNIEDSEEINITDGQLRDAVRASICLPGLFPPVVVKNKLVIDAGLMDSVPVNQIREMGCRFAISTNVMQEPKGQPLSHKYPWNLLPVVYRAMMSQGHAVGAARCERASDVVIQPDAGKITMLGFDRVDELIECGIQAGEKHVQLIQTAYTRLKERC
ncbi:MAG: cyclic nucleotide-binding and patatin-like phospholipase domain-containing protein [Planctomycetota bacterium]|nr:cyclic nucleotide-binding and patatin-like phospholipase domain-containing protein [Planctomycetota bacterium]